MNMNKIDLEQVKNIAADIISEKNDLNQINTLLQIIMRENDFRFQEQVLSYTRKVFKAIVLGKKLIQFKNYHTFDTQEIEIEDNYSKSKKEQISDQNQIQKFISEKFQAFVQILLTSTFKRDLQEELRIINLRILIELSRYHFKNVELIYTNDNNLPLIEKSEIIIQKITDLLIKSYAQSNSGEFISVIIEYLNQYYDFTIIFLVCLSKSVQKCKTKKINIQDETEKQIQEEERTTQKMILIENITSVLQDIPKFNTLQLEEIFYIQEEKKQVKKAGNFKQSEELQKILAKRKNPFSKQESERKQDDKQEKKSKILLELQNQFSELIFNTIAVIQGYPDSEIIFASCVVDYVLANMQNPLLISDYFTKVFDEAQDCNLQILSLHCILRLIGEFGLEYPKFHQKLYSLISISDIFKCEQSPKFMKMIEIVLKSQSVTMSVQASFIRRFAIVSLTQPPNTILWILSIITNTLKRNPVLTKMIDTRDLTEGIEDVFDAGEDDIYNTGAEDSFIWEIQTLKNHYLNEVNKLIDVMGSNLSITNFLETEPFSDLQYSDLIHLSFDVAEKKKQFFNVKQNVLQSSEVQVLNLELFK